MGRQSGRSGGSRVKFTADQIDSLLYTNFLIVGMYKTGKTESCATLHKLRTRKWVKGSRLHVHDFDEGCQPIIRVAKREGWANELDIFRYARVGGERLKTDNSEAAATQ